MWFLCCRITENVGNNSGFLKSNKGLLWTPELECSFFKFISYISQRESDKYIQLARISWLCIPIQTIDFPTTLSWLPIMLLQPWRDLFSDCLKQRSRMLWLSRLAVDPVGRTKVYSVYMEKNLATLGGWPYHQKGVTRLGGSPFQPSQLFVSPVNCSPRNVWNVGSTRVVQLFYPKQLFSILATGPNIQRKKHTAAWETSTELKYKNIPCTTTSGLLSVECLRFRGSISPRAIKFCLETNQKSVFPASIVTITWL